MNKTMEYVEAYSLYKLGKLSSSKIVSLANLWLDNGAYSDSLNYLYTQTNPVMADVGPLFKKAMSELGVNEPTRVEAANNVIKVTLNRIINNEVLPEEGASFLYWDVYHEIEEEYPNKEYVGDNLGLQNVFCWLREIWDCRDGSMILYHTDLPRSEAEIKFKEHLIEEASNWLNNAT